MSLSKIYRGAEAVGIRAFQFRSFGADGGYVGTEADAVPDEHFETPVVPAAPASAAPAAEELEAAYARGRREGREDADQQLASTTQALAEVLEEVSRLRESLARNSSRDMLRLVMAVAEQVIRREVAADPDAVLHIIENALQSSVRADHYRIRINPADLEYVTEKKPLFLASISGLKNLIIEADPGISQGGCRIDSDLGDVDATLETQLEAIGAALDEAIAAGR